MLPFQNTYLIKTIYFKPSEEKYATISADSFKEMKEMVDKPVLSRLLVHYENEWYSKLDAEDRRSIWEASIK